ncbi:cytochrome c oxidase accessory protein CcoG [Alphaproteobacteria bacterium 46_93_T64]|nr:cytochrome c oxidase accessory protein CcoG [Alphaproteobacteria bacterium 46_93_T64]
MQNVVDRVEVEAVNSKAKRSLYTSRKKIFPKRASGSFRLFKWWVMAVTLAIYYVTPWLRWDRGEFAPNQAVLVDLDVGRFYFFFITIWPQELYYIAGLLIMAGVGLFLVTSTVGRAWCGYTCPQTVWVDLYLWIERWIEGDRNARIKLDNGAWSGEKLFKRIAKHVIWLFVGLITGGAWVFYFADAPTLAVDLVTGKASSIAYSTIGVMTAITYVFAGFMREQVCTYMCPWPRIQGAMLDDRSLVVTYNDWRGEPRSRHQKNTDIAAQSGDCIDCNQCVVVCPMGIDIRDGQQMECITCALCIDACNGVMEKIGRPINLISYATLNDYKANVKGDTITTTWRSFIHGRTVIYSAIMVIAALLLVYVLAIRSLVDVSVLHNRNPVYTLLSDGSIRNGYVVKVLNKKFNIQQFSVSVSGITGLKMRIAGAKTDIQTELVLEVPANGLETVQLYISAKTSALNAEQNSFQFIVEDRDTSEKVIYDAVFYQAKK